MLEGKNVNLRVMDREDIDFEVECFNDIDFWEGNPLFQQTSRSESIKEFDSPSNLETLLQFKMFIVQKKDGTRIGFIWHIVTQPYRTLEISCLLIPNETGKGYGTEATRLMVDYLFLSKDITRIQTTSNAGNKAAHIALEKAGFRREGTIRKLLLVRGVWADCHLFSILREEWKEPKILTKTLSQ